MAPTHIHGPSQIQIPYISLHLSSWFASIPFFSKLDQGNAMIISSSQVELPVLMACWTLAHFVVGSPHDVSTKKLNLVGGLNPSEKYYSIGMIIPNIWENKTCSKPPTSDLLRISQALWTYLTGPSTSSWDCPAHERPWESLKGGTMAASSGSWKGLLKPEVGTYQKFLMKLVKNGFDRMIMYIYYINI